MVKETRPKNVLPTTDAIQVERHRETENKGIEKRYFLQMETNKQAGVAILIYQTK